jgi:hypothetical protein
MCSTSSAASQPAAPLQRGRAHAHITRAGRLAAAPSPRLDASRRRQLAELQPRQSSLRPRGTPLRVRASGPAGGMNTGGGGGGPSRQVDTPGKKALLAVGVGYMALIVVFPFVNVFFEVRRRQHACSTAAALLAPAPPPLPPPLSLALAPSLNPTLLHSSAAARRLSATVPSPFSRPWQTQTSCSPSR